jgi:hypothetical protein
LILILGFSMGIHPWKREDFIKIGIWKWEKNHHEMQEINPFLMIWEYQWISTCKSAVGLNHGFDHQPAVFALLRQMGDTNQNGKQVA